MRIRFLFLLLIAVPFAISARAQSAVGSISGTVTIDGKPARGVKVVALPSPDDIWNKPLSSDVTDQSGHYQLRDIPAGNYSITVDAPTLVSGDQDEDAASSGKFVSLAEGENIEGIDFEIKPGGVITGRVTEANGRPIIGEYIHIEPADDEHTYSSLSPMSRRLTVYTDDRGVYRAFGLPPGQYKVSVGNSTKEITKPFLGSLPLPITYYRSGDEPKAGIVEVKLGSETTGIDIKVDRQPLTKSYAVTGRIIDAHTGRPISGIYVSFDSRAMSFLDSSAKTDSKGEFRMDGLAPGHYTIRLSGGEEAPFYSESTPFEISGGDIHGIEIKALAAASIRGTVAVEDTNDPAILAKVAEVKIAEEYNSTGRKVNADGSFYIAITRRAERPVKFMIDYFSTPRGFSIIRVERDGIEQPNGIEVRPGEQVTGVRVVLTYYSGKILGQVRIEGGPMPEGAWMVVSVTPLDQPKRNFPYREKELGKGYAVYRSRWRQANLDARGRYTIDSLPPGEYELALDVYLTPRPRDGEWPVPLTVSKIITVTNETEMEADLMLDLRRKN